jgi:Virulence factor
LCSGIPGTLDAEKIVMTLYQILYWQDIPSQVKAWDDFDETKVELAPRFAARIDQSAQSQGLTQADDYLGQWNWSKEQERDGSPDEVARAVKSELESKFN